LKIPRIPKPPTLSFLRPAKKTSLRPAKKTTYRGSKVKSPAIKPFSPVIKSKELAQGKDRPTHIDHVEDIFIRKGEIGLSYAIHTLTELHNMLVAAMKDTSYKSSVVITEKFDGSPSIVFGRDKDTGDFFVATKSYFNKIQKLNFTEEDIRLNHGYSQNLVDKLTIALKHLPKITPRTGIFQGDLMYVQGMNVKMGTNKMSFTANTVTYSCYSDTPTGKRIYNSKIGIAIHTQHIGDQYLPANISVFNKDENVFVIDPRINLNKAYYPAEYQREFLMLMQDINNTLPMQTEYAEIMKKSVRLMRYINKQVKGIAEQRGDSEFASPVFDSFFFVHSHLQKAKKLLNNALSSTRQFYTDINGQETKGEGFVVVYEQKVSKIVDREEFSRQNFLRQTDLEKNAKTAIFAYARMNPPTRGHQHLIEQVKRLAKEYNADHTIVLSSSHDANNPLPASIKLEYLNELFPNTNFFLGNNSSADFIGRLCVLYAGGIEHLVFVAGEDREETYQTYLDAYNGKDDYFYFKKITMVSSGKRNPKGDGIEAISGTRIRQYAADNQFNAFFKDLPTTATPELAYRLFADVQKGLEP